jgi:hypothetical protein
MVEYIDVLNCGLAILFTAKDKIDPLMKMGAGVGAF